MAFHELAKKERGIEEKYSLYHYHHVAMKGRQMNRGEFTPWPTMRLP
jgi:hypothetical protein